MNADHDTDDRGDDRAAGHHLHVLRAERDDLPFAFNPDLVKVPVIDGMRQGEGACHRGGSGTQNRLGSTLFVGAYPDLFF